MEVQNEVKMPHIYFIDIVFEVFVCFFFYMKNSATDIYYDCLVHFIYRFWFWGFDLFTLTVDTA